jgi:hypothetical protein
MTLISENTLRKTNHYLCDLIDIIKLYMNLGN